MKPAAGPHLDRTGKDLTLLPEQTGAAWFEAIGTTNCIVADPAVLTDAVEIARHYLDALDRAASRFRPDSELSRLNAAARHGAVTAVLSPLLARALRVAAKASRLTDGLVDPTVGRALEGIGYDRDLTLLLTCPDPVQRQARPVPGWERITLDPRSRLLTMPAGTALDLGATGKAFAADELATLIGRDLSGGFLIDLGGDIAVGGALPRNGWRVGVQGPDGGTLQVVTSHGQALATSSTQVRCWPTVDGAAHHIVDPRTGDSAATTWAQVTCSAATAVEANAASTAAVILGEDAPAWLAAQGVGALLVRPDGSRVRTADWPVEQRL